MKKQTVKERRRKNISVKIKVLSFERVKEPKSEWERKRERTFLMIENRRFSLFFPRSPSSLSNSFWRHVREENVKVLYSHGKIRDKSPRWEEKRRRKHEGIEMKWRDEGARECEERRWRRRRRRREPREGMYCE